MTEDQTPAAPAETPAAPKRKVTDQRLATLRIVLGDVIPSMIERARTMDSDAEILAFLKSQLGGDVASAITGARARLPKKRKPPSRAERWSDAAGRAEDALNELVEIQGELVEWKDNLDGKFEGSPLVEKLDAICDMDLEGAKSTAEDANGADFPLGFGRD